VGFILPCELEADAPVRAGDQDIGHASLLRRHSRESGNPASVPARKKKAGPRLRGSDGQSNRLDTDASSEIRRIASASSGATVRRRIFAPLGSASPVKMVSVTTSSLN